MKPNVYRTQARLDAVETVASNALTEAKRAHKRLDHQPPRGEKGETGPPGTAGKDAVCICKNGRDGAPSTVPGPVGPQGRPGRDCQCKTELAEQRIAGIVSNLSEARGEVAALKAEIRDMKLSIQGLIDMNKKSSEYLTWLRERAAAWSKK